MPQSRSRYTQDALGLQLTDIGWEQTTMNMGDTTMAKDTTYNGWTNYETWAVALWIDNEESTYTMRRGWASDIKADVTATDIWTVEEAQRFAMADRIKSFVEEYDPLADKPSLYSDLLSAAISEVNWYEIAENWLAED